MSYLQKNYRRNENASLTAHTNKFASNTGPRNVLGDIGSNLNAIQDRNRVGLRQRPQARPSNRPAPSLIAPRSLDALRDVERLSDNLNGLQFENIDIEDAQNPQNVPEYVNEVYEHMRESESRYMPEPSYMTRQNDITEEMRFILVDWLIEVHLKFKLMQETIFSAVNILDRYLARKPVRRSQVQLVGVTALLIASKLEEIYTPEVRDYVYITDNAYKVEDVTKMEVHMLQVLNYDLMVPSALHFLRRFSKAARSNIQHHTIAKYLCEIALVNYKMLIFAPSQIAAAATFMSHKMMNSTPWSPTLQYYSRYTEENIMPCVRMLVSQSPPPPYTPTNHSD
eukprot:TRINITY_DN3317_c0_g1_i1.p1 TRINITY_DN3317_c0_g1~~TRINITY_DN3317_c0_g1_i1.p1  ORF type:complete len:339 (+),score=73.62 TRINITY_DN3317_c0_g1_i1:98-1114(+)